MDYTETMREKTQYFAASPPETVVRLGDFGTLEGATFKRQGSLKPEELASIGERKSPGTTSYDVLYNANRQVKVGADVEAKVDVAKGKAMLEIGFSSTDAVVFAAPDTTSVEMDDLVTLGRTLLARRKEEGWDLNHVVVSRVVTAPRATIVLSNANTAKLEFEVDGKAPVDTAMVANLDAKASFLNAEGVGIQIIGEGPLTPLFGLVQLKIKLFGGHDVVHRGEEEDGLEIDEEHLLVDYGPPPAKDGARLKRSERGGLRREEAPLPWGRQRGRQPARVRKRPAPVAGLVVAEIEMLIAPSSPAARVEVGGLQHLDTADEGAARRVVDAKLRVELGLDAPAGVQPDAA